MGRLFVVGAPSGTGKTTLLKLLLERVERLRFSVSHTTRAPRPGEVAGRDYHFVGREEFERRAAAGEFLEWAVVYDRLYGTHRSELERAAASGCDLLLDIDVQGARAVRRQVPDAALVLVLPPSWEALEKRLRARGTESEEGIARRLAQSQAQLGDAATYDYAIINDDMETAYRALEAIVLAERQRVPEQAAALRRLLESGHV